MSFDRALRVAWLALAAATLLLLYRGELSLQVGPGPYDSLGVHLDGKVSLDR